jgi:hypothetical protein
MNSDKFASLISRLIVLAAFVLLIVGIVEAVANMFGYTFLHEAHKPSRLIESAAELTVIVIALLLRQIREQLHRSG